MSNLQPIRVLHIITRLIVGGAQENTLLSVEGLDRLPEYEVTLVTGVDNGPEGDLLERARRTTRLVIVPELGRSINPLSDVVAFYKLYRVIRTGRYHIVHTHSSKAGVLGRLAAKLAGTPIVVHTLHSLVFHDYQPWLVNRLWWAVKMLCAPLTDHFISVSSVISQKAIAAGIGRPEKFTTIYSGMELDWFLDSKVDPAAVRREFGIPEDAPVVGKIDGLLYEHLRSRAREAGILDNFVFAGLIPRERIPEMIAGMDVVVHTSLREGLARVLPQALAMGKPCVSFDLDGAPEVVVPGETGFLVKPGDVRELADAISELLANPQLRARMGEAGRHRVDPAFRAETMVEQIASVYQSLLSRYAGRLSRFDRRQAPNMAEVMN